MLLSTIGWWEMQMAVIKLAIGKQGRMRLKTHFGSNMECQYALSAFGIPVQHLMNRWEPKSEHQKEHQAWLSQMAMNEELASLAVDNVTPTSRDIVMGRGRPYQEFAGNVALKKVIDDRFEEYQTSFRVDKVALFRRVVQDLQAGGVRFLEKNPEATKDETQTAPEWREISEERARGKISHAFRNKRVLDKYHENFRDELSDADVGKK